MKDVKNVSFLSRKWDTRDHKFVLVAKKDLNCRYIGKVWLAKLVFSITTEYNYVFSWGQPWILNNKEMRIELIKSTFLLQTSRLTNLVLLVSCYIKINFELFTAGNFQFWVFWVMMPCTLTGEYKFYRGTLPPSSGWKYVGWGIGWFILGRFQWRWTLRSTGRGEWVEPCLIELTCYKWGLKTRVSSL
jgi:hypothetical protein